MDTFKTISVSDAKYLCEKKFFTLDEANRALPLVQRIVVDILRDFQLLRELHNICRSFGPHADSIEAEDARRKYATVNDHLAELTEELESLGCELKDYQLGVVEFPGKADGSDKPGGRNLLYHWRPGADCVTLAG